MPVEDKQEHEIPWLVKLAYELALNNALPGLSEQMKATGAFESGCRYWMNKQIDKLLNIEHPDLDEVEEVKHE